MYNAESLYSEVSILDAQRFPNVDALRAAAEATSTSSLLLVDPNELSEVLTWIDDKDDVCLRDSPPELIAHRAKCLKLGMESMLDPLTRVLSRQRFDQSLCRAVLDASSDQPISLMLGDLDHFKSINDQFGYEAGDEILCLVASVLKQHCDRSAIIGRLSGEEFAVVCNRDACAAMMLAHELGQKTKSCQTDAGASVTISFGVATTKRSMDGHKLIQCADQALFSAKANGRDCCVSYGDMEANCRSTGDDVDVVGLENHARVLSDRVASFITIRSRKLISTVRKEADIDGLTECFNRRYLDRRLGAEFDNRDDHPLTVAFLDLDHFGQVNKQHGWPTGDKLLVEVCDMLRSHVRTTDWIGRYGGEEFCVVMPNTTQADAKAILSRVREAVEMTKFMSTTNKPLRMTLSIGTATAITADTSHVDLLDRASLQALSAKRSGRNQLCLAE